MDSKSLLIGINPARIASKTSKTQARWLIYLLDGSLFGFQKRKVDSETVEKGAGVTVR